MARWSRSRRRARCPICLEEPESEEQRALKQSVAVLPCQHVLCSDCFVNYVESLVNQGKVKDITCPLPECQRILATDTLAQLLQSADGENVFLRLLDFQAQRLEPSEGERLLTCPTPGGIQKSWEIVSTFMCSSSCSPLKVFHIIFPFKRRSFLTNYGFAGCLKLLVPLALVEDCASAACLIGKKGKQKCHWGNHDMNVQHVLSITLF